MTLIMARSVVQVHPGPPFIFSRLPGVVPKISTISTHNPTHTCLAPPFQERCPKKCCLVLVKRRRHSPFRLRRIRVYCAYFFISEETNRREMLVEDLVSTLGSIVQRDLCHVRS